MPADATDQGDADHRGGEQPDRAERNSVSNSVYGSS